MAIYKRSREVELGATENSISKRSERDLNPGTYGFQIRRSNHSATLPPKISVFSLFLQWKTTKYSWLYEKPYYSQKIWVESLIVGHFLSHFEKNSDKNFWYFVEKYLK